MKTTMRYSRSWLRCTILALSVPIAARVASGAPQDLPIEIANSIEDATDSLSGQLERLFEARNQALQLVLKERLAERVLELETALAHKDRRIAQLEKQIPGSEAPAQSEGQDGSDSEEASTSGLEESSGDDESAFEDGDALDEVEEDSTLVDEYDLDTSEETIPYTECEREYLSDRRAYSESLTSDLPSIASELRSVIENANEELATEVFQVLGSRNAELGLVVEGLIESQITDLENESKAKDLWIADVRRAVADLQSLMTTSPDAELEAETIPSESTEGLYEPLGSRFEGDSTALESGVASEPASLDTVTASTEEEDSLDQLPEYDEDEIFEDDEDANEETLPLGPAQDEDTSTDNVDPAPSTTIDDEPAPEDNSIPVETPSSKGPKIDIGRVETTNPEIQSSEDELTVDSANSEELLSSAESTSGAEEAIEPSASTIPAADQNESDEEYDEYEDSQDNGDTNTP